MAKHIFSYLAPVVGVLTLVYCDAVYVYIRLFLTPTTTAIYDYTLVGVLNILVLLAFWSLFATIVSDPGYTPLNYQCNPKLMSKTVTVTCTMKVVMMNRISKVSSSLIAKSWVKTYLYPRGIKPSTRNGMNGSLQLQVERVSRKLSMPLKPACDA